MRKAFLKYGLLAIASIGLILVALFGKYYDEKHTDKMFTISADNGFENVSFIPYKADEGQYLVFLPSYAVMDEMSFSIPRGSTLLLEGAAISHGTTCGDLNLELEKEYEILFDNTSASLRFYQSANVATMHLNTATGSMEKVDADKEYKETTTLALLNADGSLDCFQDMCTVKGRGNWTWLPAKKPYVLTLNTANNLLGMGESTDWVLLANAVDESNLNNKLVFDLARGINCGWIPKCEYVDLYLNGNYNGLYLLTEKIEIADNRVDIDMKNGDFLCKIDFHDRWEILNNPFLTEQERTVAIEFPRSIEDSQKLKIQAQVNELERTIMSPNLDLTTQTNFDMDSWVRRYLIDEISANMDSDLASSYFYYDDGTFYAGPLWDYDITFGINKRNKHPHAFIARILQRVPGHFSLYYDSLYENRTFYNRMVEIYRTELLPLLNTMIQGEIQQIGESIQEASRMNFLRWEEMFQGFYSSGISIKTTTDTLVDYIDSRVEFLNRAWIEGVDFCTVKFSADGIYQMVSVEKGKYLQSSYIEDENSVWIDEKTNEIFDISRPITESMILIKQDDANQDTTNQDTINQDTTNQINEPEDPPQLNEIPIHYWAVGASLAMIICLFICLVVVDVRRFLHRKGDT